MWYLICFFFFDIELPLRCGLCGRYKLCTHFSFDTWGYQLAYLQSLFYTLLLQAKHPFVCWLCPCGHRIVCAVEKASVESRDVCSRGFSVESGVLYT